MLIFRFERDRFPNQARKRESDRNQITLPSAVSRRLVNSEEAKMLQKNCRLGGGFVKANLRLNFCSYL
ncbi:hypothetical protein [Nostoc sp. NMS4]|uniref:hypothetical protein n=1 Tax=Nostoc sp. NMS4 TaxID=2815390 RepID=UPI0025E1D5E6|nr:hypothetical protein [Nostoc sp. NMS4]MBN3926861.1 hypothetical protein [Nostoc sp. NMS4]